MQQGRCLSHRHQEEDGRLMIKASTMGRSVLLAYFRRELPDLEIHKTSAYFGGQESTKGPNRISSLLPFESKQSRHRRLRHTISRCP